MHKLRDSDLPVDVAWPDPASGIDLSPAEIQTTATRAAARAAVLGRHRGDMCCLAFDATPAAAFSGERPCAAHGAFMEVVADTLPILDICSEKASRLPYVRFVALARVTDVSIFEGMDDRKIASDLGVSPSAWRAAVEDSARKLGRPLSCRLDFGTTKKKRVLPRPPGV